MGLVGRKAGRPAVGGARANDRHSLDWLLSKKAEVRGSVPQRPNGPAATVFITNIYQTGMFIPVNNQTYFIHSPPATLSHTSHPILLQPCPNRAPQPPPSSPTLLQFFYLFFSPGMGSSINSPPRNSFLSSAPCSNSERPSGLGGEDPLTSAETPSSSSLGPPMASDARASSCGEGVAGTTSSFSQRGRPAAKEG